MKEIRLLKRTTITVLYHLAGYTVLAGCVHFIFSLFWWLKNGVWTEDFIAVWIAMITSINWGDYNWDDDGTAINIEVEVQPDYCVLNF